jgi:hypothetical protein
MTRASFQPHFATTLGEKSPAADARHAFDPLHKSEQTMAQTPTQTARTSSATPSQTPAQAPSGKTISSNVFKDFASI